MTKLALGLWLVIAPAWITAFHGSAPGLRALAPWTPHRWGPGSQAETPPAPAAVSTGRCRASALRGASERSQMGIPAADDVQSLEEEAAAFGGAGTCSRETTRKRDRVATFARRAARTGRDLLVGRPGGTRHLIRQSLRGIVSGQDESLGSGDAWNVTNVERVTGDADSDRGEAPDASLERVFDASARAKRGSKARKHLMLTRLRSRCRAPQAPLPLPTTRAAQTISNGKKVSGPGEFVQRTCVVPASVEVCFAVASDLDSYRQWCHSGLRKLDVLERDEHSSRPSLVRMEVGKYGKPVSLAYMRIYARVCLQDVPGSLISKLFAFSSHRCALM